MKFPIIAAILGNFSSHTVFVSSQRYQDYFPPSEEEYNPLFFDPNSLFGAPLGGYARATRSRLAALPLRLVGGSVFWTDEQDQDKDAPDNDDSDSEVEDREPDAPYFTMRDGTGRQFACRIYNEDELTAESISQSMFTKALGVDSKSNNNLYHEEGQSEESEGAGSVDSDTDTKNDSKVNGNENNSQPPPPKLTTEKDLLDKEENIATSKERDASGNARDEEPDIEIDIVFKEADTIGNDSFDDDFQLVIEQMVEAKKDLLVLDDITITNLEQEVDTKLIAKALDELKDRCAQLHSGWWSYEWCHAKEVKQFHIQMQSNTMDDVVNVHDLMPEFVVQSISTVGKYKKRKIVVELSDPKFYDGADDGTNESESDDATSTDAADDGNVDSDDSTSESESEAAVSTDTNSDESVSGSESGTDAATDGGTSKSIHKDIDVDLEMESITVVETYVDGEYCEEIKAKRSVEVHLKCCSDDEVQNYLQIENGGMSNMNNGNKFSLESSEEPLAILLSVREDSTCSYTATVCTNVLCDEWIYAEDDSESFDPLTGDNAPDNTFSRRGGIEFRRDDSIRYILDRTLEDTCLRRNEGWWTFSYCHKSSAYQYHENADIDLTKGTMKTTIEAKNILGKYEAKNDNFPDEDEVKHIVFPNSDDEAGSSSTQARNVGVNSPYYTQEFFHGDICEGEDVIDSAIKGGNVIEGGVGVERSSIIRFFCGNTRELVRVDEDHTCHYIIDITVPELCLQKYFEIPHIKKHAVKCLPVD